MMRLAVAALLSVLVATVPALAVTRHGTSRNDTVRGTQRADRLSGLKGNDRVLGRGGNDRLYGNTGNDRLDGGAGDDGVDGGPGDDVLVGGPGEDEFNTGPETFAPDRRDGDRFGGEGNDRIEARDGELDTINCGPGEDVAIVDAEEEGVFDCEEVQEP
jgi:RTX calcium-binding nonapeptide repeat (4 copies)